MVASLGPPYRVSVTDDGRAVVTLPLDLAETLKPKLLAYGFACELSAAESGAALLDFGVGVDVSRLQSVIDSFTVPPIAVITGS